MHRSFPGWWCRGSFLFTDSTIDEQGDTSRLQASVQQVFNLGKEQSVFYCDWFAIKFYKAAHRNYGNTVRDCFTSKGFDLFISFINVGKGRGSKSPALFHCAHKKPPGDYSPGDAPQMPCWPNYNLHKRAGGSPKFCFAASNIQLYGPGGLQSADSSRHPL